MATGDLITQKEAAVILNRSVSAVSRALRDGRLEYIDSERRLLHRPGLEARFRQTTRPRIDALQPQRKAQMKPVPHRLEAPPVSTDYWQRLQDKLSVVLDGGPVYWHREPNPHQLMLFCQTIDELRQQCEMEGLSPP